jgi:hypothetical protein
MSLCAQARGGRKKAGKKSRLAPGEKAALRKEGIQRKRAQRAAGRGLDLPAVDQVRKIRSGYGLGRWGQR